ncbi:hypothetical protein KY361_06365 [Candidatus Woesearchaeota archaeon]|nr:hypothetical protein [Candidatus Woesearchaeota archaeon]
MPYLPPGHRRAGWTVVPKGNGSFSGPADTRVPHPGGIGKKLEELEEALRNGQVPADLADQISRSFDYAERAKEELPWLNLLPEGYSELKRRFYALANVHQLKDKKGNPITTPQELDNSREVVEAYLGVLRVPTTKEYATPYLLGGLARLSETNPEAAFELVTGNASRITEGSIAKMYLSHSIGIPMQDAGLLHVLGHYELLPAHGRLPSMQLFPESWYREREARQREPAATR